MEHHLLAKFELSAWLEDWIEDPRVIFKGMFGGLTVYLNGKQVLFICEDPVQTTYKNIDFGSAIWDGFLFPTERDQHSSLMAEFPSLVQHPVLPKWLYLPKSDNEFETVLPLILNRVFKGDSRFGILPGSKKKSKKRKKKRAKTASKTGLKTASKGPIGRNTTNKAATGVARKVRRRVVGRVKKRGKS